MTLYINCQPWQLEPIRSILKNNEKVGTDSYCFRENTYVIEGIENQSRLDSLSDELISLAIKIPLQ